MTDSKLPKASMLEMMDTVRCGEYAASPLSTGRGLPALSSLHLNCGPFVLFNRVCFPLLMEPDAFRWRSIASSDVNVRGLLYSFQYNPHYSSSPSMAPFCMLTSQPREERGTTGTYFFNMYTKLRTCEDWIVGHLQSGWDSGPSAPAKPSFGLD